MNDDIFKEVRRAAPAKNEADYKRFSAFAKVFGGGIGQYLKSEQLSITESECAKFNRLFSFSFSTYTRRKGKQTRILTHLKAIVKVGAKRDEDGNPIDEGLMEPDKQFYLIGNFTRHCIALLALKSVGMSSLAKKIEGARYRNHSPSIPTEYFKINWQNEIEYLIRRARKMPSRDGGGCRFHSKIACRTSTQRAKALAHAWGFDFPPSNPIEKEDYTKLSERN